MLTVKTAAKINLVLDITDCRGDGYHSVSTVMQSATLYDYITIEKTQGGIGLSGNIPYIPYDAHNLVWRAAAAFFEASGADGGARMRLTKHIPIQAGLGGGSGDAAGVLMGLNRLYGDPLDDAALLAAAASLGADVPFGLTGGTMLAQGIGELLTPLRPLPDCLFLIVKDRAGVSSRAAYAEYDACPSPPRADVAAMLRAIEAGDIRGVAGALDNVFYPMTADRRPALERTVRSLKAYGALGACMSGSGSAVYGIFDDPDAAAAALTVLRGRHDFACMAHPAARGCEIIEEGGRPA